MRLWTLHPKYLDPQGLVALWREALLAQKVLLGRTRGYRHHPQLERFRDQKDPVTAVGEYLRVICDEADRRGYEFCRDRISATGRVGKIRVSRGQLEYETQHLLGKLKIRNRRAFENLSGVRRVVAHPLFRVVPGGIADWERGGEKSNKAV